MEGKRSLQMFSAVLIVCALLCAGCAAASKSLSDEEIAGFNTEFFNNETNQMNNMLLSSEYDTPEEIDLSRLFYNGFYNSAGDRWSQADGEELALLAELDSEALYLDVMKVTAEELEAVLQEKLGLGLEETQKKGLENFYYMEEYDSYYLIHGDSNFDWCSVTSGTREAGGKITLEYTKEYEGGRWTVTLQETDGGYLFVSNRRVG